MYRRDLKCSYIGCLIDNADAPGNNIGGINVHQNIISAGHCQAICRSETTCQYFVYHKRAKTCTLKTYDAITNIKKNNGEVFGSRDCKFGKLTFSQY